MRASILFSLFFVLGLLACETPTETSLYDPELTGAPDPAITQVTPAGAAYAGVSTVEIVGTNFSDVL